MRGVGFAHLKVDEWQKRLQEKAELNHENWIRIRDRRYVLSELYVIGWLGIAPVLLIFNQLLPITFVYVLMLRALEFSTRKWESSYSESVRLLKAGKSLLLPEWFFLLCQTI